MARSQIIIAASIVGLLLVVGSVGLLVEAGAAQAGAHHHRHPTRRSRAHHRRGHRPTVRPAAGPAEAPGSVPQADGSALEAPAAPAIAPAVAVDGPLWEEQFEGPPGAPPDPSRWSFDTGGGGWGNEELESYTDRPENAALDGQGDLVITARREGYSGADGIHRDYTSARLQTLGKFEFTYGTLEARIEVPEGQGLAPAFWTLGADAYEGEGHWPACGEIDAMEVLGQEPDVLDGTAHGPWPADPHGVGGETRAPESLAAGFHVYAVEWTPERLTFRLDGRTYETVSRSQLPPSYAWPFEGPQFILLNLAVGGEWPGAPDAATPFPARMLVDWVRVHS